MKKITLILTAAILTACLFSVTAFKTMPPPGPSANGQGSLIFDGRFQHFSFHANTDNNGNVTGSFELKSPAQDVRLHGSITCLRVRTDGKTAFMSGQITHRDGNGFPGEYQVGEYVYFQVQDNGEGSNAASDKFSDVYSSGGSQVCISNLIGLQNIETGNIQVKK